MQELGIQRTLTPESPESNPGLYVSRAVIQSILESAQSTDSVLKAALQSVLDQGKQYILKSTIQSILNSTAQPTLGSSLTPEPEPELPPDTRPIWPGRIELIYKAYVAEKEAWLAAHPTVRPSSYRQKRGFTDYPIRYCKEQVRYLPTQRLDLQSETLLEGRPHWTTEEIQAWLDNEALKEQEVERQVEAELVATGGFGRERGVQGLWSRIQDDITAQAREFRFVF
jgi:hypothetical protein